MTADIPSTPAPGPLPSSGPATNGPAGSGPAGSGPAGSGPAGSGPAGSGPAVPPVDPAASRPRLPVAGPPRKAPSGGSRLWNRLKVSVRRPIALPILLFVLTCLSTFAAQSIHALGVRTLPEELLVELRLRPREGLLYMAAVMAILVAHEMGHFLQAVRYGLPVSLPYFIPMPFTPIGTLGAVLDVQEPEADRRQLFDIGLSGPIAGLVVAIPIIILGIRQATPAASHPAQPIVLNDPLLVELLFSWLRPDLPAAQAHKSPLLMAGWVGMLVTGLNMLPMGQLDGGHVASALIGKSARWLARGFMLSVLGYIIWNDQYLWAPMLILILLIGIDHPPTKNEMAPLGWPRRLLGTVSLAIPLLCLSPVPASLGGP